MKRVRVLIAAIAIILAAVLLYHTLPGNDLLESVVAVEMPEDLRALTQANQAGTFPESHPDIMDILEGFTISDPDSDRDAATAARVRQSRGWSAADIQSLEEYMQYLRAPPSSDAKRLDPRGTRL